MTTRGPPKKIFVAFDPARAEAADQVLETLRRLGLETFRADRATGVRETIEDTLWRAIHEADAFVALVGPEPLNPNAMLELGAAVGLGKPIFLLAVDQARVNLPFDLRRFRILPLSRANELPYLLGDAVATTRG